MSQERRNTLADYFTGYDPVVQRIVKQVLLIEQEKIDDKKPRVKDDIREVIEREVHAL